MKHFDEIYEIAADNYGLITAAQAKDVGVVGAELNRYGAAGWLRKLGHGVYKITRYAPTEYDAYAEAVMQVGKDACLYGEAVLAMHGLALVNPAKITVATARRKRRRLPGWIEVVTLKEPVKVVSDMGIPSQSVAEAIRTCKGRIMPERLSNAVEDARSKGLLTTAEYNELKEEFHVSENAE